MRLKLITASLFLAFLSWPVFGQPPDAELAKLFKEECISLKTQFALLDPNHLIAGSTQNGTCKSGTNSAHKQSLYNQIKFKNFDDRYEWLKKALSDHTPHTDQSKNAIARLDELAKSGFPYLDTLNFITSTFLPVIDSKTGQYNFKDITNNIEKGIFYLPLFEELSPEFFNQVHAGDLKPCFPIGLVSKPAVADGVTMTPACYAHHDLIHARSTDSAIKDFTKNNRGHVLQMRKLQLDFSKELLTNPSIPEDIRNVLNLYFFYMTHESNEIWTNRFGVFPEQPLAELQQGGGYQFRHDFSNHQILEASLLIKDFLAKQGLPNFQLSSFYTSYLKNEFTLQTGLEQMLKILKTHCAKTKYDIVLLYEVIKNLPHEADSKIIARFFLDEWLKDPPKDSQTLTEELLIIQHVPLFGKNKLDFLMAILKSSTLPNDAKRSRARMWRFSSPFSEQDLIQISPIEMMEYGRALQSATLNL